ncbi:MAG TPA: Mur ligase family protein [Rhizomicrobium sp.]|jgi:UDP-N-acetylmuramate--alanine ligase|nr:Mur ligase family protein [Rhizomicrobium sp.]
MDQDRPYFFCGIGGSGMLPLALILREKGIVVAGSDRALDQGRTEAKFDFLRGRGIALFAQDGSGIVDPKQIVVASAAVEDTVPDMRAARRLGNTLVTRAALLADLFNAAPTSIGVAGTSGKSTTTGMIGWILKATGRDPTVMNGAVMTNFVSASAPFASALVGKGGIFVSEVDESDGSIALYSPSIAVVNNISLDHKSMDELRALFGDFTAKAKVAVLNLDNEETVALIPGAKSAITYSLSSADADLRAEDIRPAPDGITFDVLSSPPPRGEVEARSASGGGGSPTPAPHPKNPSDFSTSPQGGGNRLHVRLRVPGRHNVSNALAALAAAYAAGVPLEDAAAALQEFKGVRRRMEVVGTANGVTMIDDFAHNPDKIAATLSTLHDFPGRLLVMFQPHGFSPLMKMRGEFVDCFARNLAAEDILIMPEPVYFGGTTTRDVTSADIAQDVRARGRQALSFDDRAACGKALLERARQGDRMVVMGARDDTLTQFAGEMLKALA